MRKISKAVAALTAGCMLLSTSAFAAITDNIDGKAQLVNGEYTVNLDYTTAGQSTIIVLKEGTALADANETNILYINQAAIADGKATYAINLGTSFAGNAVVYAGGTAETATELGTLTTIKDVVGLTLAADKTTLEIGETATITPTFDPEDATDKTLTWTSSNDAIATVANGVVTAVAEGTATITATTTNGKTATIDITVNASSTAVEELAIQMNMLQDDGSVARETVTEILGIVNVPIELFVKALPEDAEIDEVVWSSDDEEIATVEDGVVTLLAHGDVVITATVGEISAEVVIESRYFGDVDEDEEISLLDALEIINYYYGEDNILVDEDGNDIPKMFTLADIDEDGELSLLDALEIINYYYGDGSILDDFI